MYIFSIATNLHKLAVFYTLLKQVNAARLRDCFHLWIVTHLASLQEIIRAEYFSEDMESESAGKMLGFFGLFRGFADIMRSVWYNQVSTSYPMSPSGHSSADTKQT